MVPSRDAALESPSSSDFVESSENGNYSKSQPLETVKMGDKHPCGLVPSRDAALGLAYSPSDLVESSANGYYSKSQPLETVKMGDKDPYGLVPSRDAALRSPSSPSDLVESSENGKFSSFFTAFLLQFLSFKKYFYPFEKNERKKGRSFSL